jgi:hypothetical protein
MGWELRHDRWYLYRNRRVNGKPVKEYLAASDDFGSVMAHALYQVQQQQAEVRELLRESWADYRDRIENSLTAVTVANAELRSVAEGILYAIGYHKHHRGEWRMKGELALIKSAIEQLKSQAANSKPLLNYSAPSGDAKALELFAKARAGDAEAQNAVRDLIRERKWVDWIGDIGRQATRQLIGRGAGGDQFGRRVSPRRRTRFASSCSGTVRLCWRNYSSGGW